MPQCHKQADKGVGCATCTASDKKDLTASQINWIAVKGLKQAAELKNKIRYAHREAEAMVTPLDEEGVHVEVKLPQMAIAPGQAIVFYDGDTVVGGGIIEKTGANEIWAE